MKHTLAWDISGELVLLLICGMFTTVAATGLTYLNQTSTSDYLSPLQDQVLMLESMVEIPGSTIASNIPYSVVYANLARVCTQESIDLAYDQFDQIVQETSFNVTDIESDPNNTARRYRTVRNMITKIKTNNDATFCTQKYLTYLLLEMVQFGFVTNKSSESHLLSNDSEQIHGAANTEHSIDVVHHLSGVSNDEMIFVEMTQYTINQVSQEMIKQGFLTPNDIVNLDNAIEISYVNKCGVSHGSFYMTQSGIGPYIFKKLTFAVNLCNDAYYLRNFQDHVAQIFIHEIGHYLYYFKDPRIIDFNAICWQAKVKICTDQEFISMYASTNFDEDYAESFAYRYLQHTQERDQGTYYDQDYSRVSKLDRKNQYFDEVFGELLFSK